MHHPWAVNNSYPDCYLNEFTFRSIVGDQRVKTSSSFACLSKLWASILLPVTDSLPGPQEDRRQTTIYRVLVSKADTHLSRTWASTTSRGSRYSGIPR